MRGLKGNVPSNGAEAKVVFRRRSVLVAALLVLTSAVALASASTAQSSFPGANGKLAFTSLDGAIYVMDAAGGSPQDITSSFYDTNPVWSVPGRI
jgi:hypothetical protein